MPKRPSLPPASRYEVLAPTRLPGYELEDARLLPIDWIDPNPYQARQAFDPLALEELADSIREHGVIEPIIVRPVGGRYEIVAGERRHRAAGLAGQETIPVRIMDLNTEQAAFITAIENLQREDLDIEDEARQFAYLLEVTGMSQRRLAGQLGVNYNYLSRRVRLLKRPDLMEQYRSGRKKLHEALALLDAPLAIADADFNEDADDGAEQETVSPGHNTDPDDDIELVEREDLPGYIVSRGHSSEGGAPSLRRETFRWRPAMQFRNWLTRTKPEAIPVEERATFKAQIAEIRSQLEEWEKALEQAQ